MSLRRTTATIRKDYRNAIEEVKALTKGNDYVKVPTITIAKKHKIRMEFLRVMEQFDMVKNDGNAPRLKKYRWNWGINEIDDKLIDKLYNEISVIRRNYHERWMNGKKAVVKEPVKRKYTPRQPAESKGALFGLRQLDFLKLMEMEKPTTVLFDNGCEYDGVRKLEFDVQNSSLVVKVFIKTETTTIMEHTEERVENELLVGKLPLVNKRLAFSKRFADSKTSNLFVEILPI